MGSGFGRGHGGATGPGRVGKPCWHGAASPCGAAGSDVQRRGADVARQRARLQRRLPCAWCKEGGLARLHAARHADGDAAWREVRVSPAPGHAVRGLACPGTGRGGRGGTPTPVGRRQNMPTADQAVRARTSSEKCVAVACPASRSASAARRAAIIAASADGTPPTPTSAPPPIMEGADGARPSAAAAACARAATSLVTSALELAPAGAAPARAARGWRGAPAGVVLTMSLSSRPPVARLTRSLKAALLSFSTVLAVQSATCPHTHAYTHTHTRTHAHAHR
jgi:hypothetical protein